MNLLHLLIVPALLVASVASIALTLLLSLSRDSFAYARPFGISEGESLMNFSPLGSLECNCLPTDAAAPVNDRRSSCRSCGNMILAPDSVRLYEPLSRSEIRRITRNLRRAGMDARRVALPTSVTSLSELHSGSKLANLSVR